MTNFKINMNLDQYEALTDLICFEMIMVTIITNTIQLIMYLTIWQTQLLEQKEYEKIYL